MKVLFIGSVQFSEKMLLELIKLNANIVGVCTLKESEANSDHFDLSKVAKKSDIPFKYTPDINSDDNKSWIKSLKPDIIFCLGWSKLLDKNFLKLAPRGVIGFHPTALPKNRGRHPIIWSLVLGLKSSACTFFQMEEGADTGNILSQKIFKISEKDNASSVYQKVEKIAVTQIKNLFHQLKSDSVLPIVQNHSQSNSWRKRNKEDGRIDWRMPSKGIYNLVRGLSHPYPGAHFEYKDTNIILWSCKVLSDFPDNIEPGKILGTGEKGPIIKSGDGALELLDFEPKINFVLGEYL